MATQFLNPDQSADQSADRFERTAGELEGLFGGIGRASCAPNQEVAPPPRPRPAGKPAPPAVPRVSRPAAIPQRPAAGAGGRFPAALVHGGWLGIATATLVAGIYFGGRDRPDPAPALSGSIDETSPALGQPGRPAQSALPAPGRPAGAGRAAGLVSGAPPGWAGSDADLSAGAMRAAAGSLLAPGPSSAAGWWRKCPARGLPA